MEKKTFLFLTTFYPPYHIGGDAIHAYQLANALSKIGHEVHIIHLLDSYLIKRKYPRSGNYPHADNVIIHTLKSPYGISSLFRAYVLGESKYINNEVKNIINRVQPDVLHCHNIAGFGPNVLKYSAPKVLYTAHDYWAVCPLGTLTKSDGSICYCRSYCSYCLLNAKRPFQLWRYTSHIKNYFSYVDTVISPSLFLKTIFEKNCVTENVVCIPNFASLPQAEIEPLYQFKYFLFVGALERHKGILNLLKAFINVKNGTDSRLLIVGSGSLEAKIHEEIALDNCSDQVKVLVDVDNSILQSLYAHAEAVIVPSTWPENNPLVALEALANGTPVIVSDQGGLPEIASIINKKLIFKIEDINELEQIILNFNKNDYDFRLIKDTYRNNFSLEKYMDRYFKLL